MKRHESGIEIGRQSVEERGMSTTRRAPKTTIRTTTRNLVIAVMIMGPQVATPTRADRQLVVEAEDGVEEAVDCRLVVSGRVRSRTDTTTTFPPTLPSMWTTIL